MAGRARLAGHAVDFSAVAVEKGRELDGTNADAAIDWVVADATTYTSPEPVDLALLCYLQLPAAQRRAAVRHAAAGARARAGRCSSIGHDSRNLTDGTGGPQDPAVLFTAADIAADLAGSGLRDRDGGEVLRPVDGRRPPGHRRAAARATAYSALIAASQAAGVAALAGPFISVKRTTPSLSTRNVPRLAMPAVSLNDAVGLRHRAVRPEVGQQRELVALALGEDLVRVGRVDADRQHLHVVVLEASRGRRAPG